MVRRGAEAGAPARRPLLSGAPPWGAGGDAVPGPAGRKEDVRLRLGRWLALALEFELAADILRTAVAPTWNEIGQLAAIIVLRTALNYFLQREIETSRTRELSRAVSPAAALAAE